MPRKTPKDSSPLFTSSPSAHAAPPASPPAFVPPSSPTASFAPNVQSSSADGPPFSLEPRKPRLFWNGMERKPQVTSVPTQVLEIVRPGLAMDRGIELAGTSARPVQARNTKAEAVATPQNRLIWTNDNLVALKTLLDERDPRTRDYRYRGKVDLIYIDPPFMVNNDFRADNSIDIEIDEAEGVQAKKEPSLVELIAYKDTWRQGLDSFLSMLRARLMLLKEFLVPTGSIYVHLDWHAVHYVKVMMDEIFGYENFQNEIIWKRTSARSDSVGFNHVHDTILVYGIASKPFWNPVYGPLSQDYIKSHYNHIDETSGQRYRLGDLTSPQPRPNMMYSWKGYPSPKNGWRFSLTTMQEMDEKGLIYYPEKGNRPAFKRYLDDEGMPLLSTWLDISPVNPQAIERLGYPTQKPVPLIERIIAASCPPSGTVLDCFVGSGTTCEAAERLGRKWIGIDNGKYGIHLARKRLIILHGQERPPEKAQHDYVECKACKNIERKERKQRSPGRFQVHPFTVENMGVYQRAGEWQDFQTQRSRYRDEMLAVFGGKVVPGYQFLHGRKGDERDGGWVHIGPLDGPIAVHQVWQIAREAQGTDTKRVTVLSADFDTLSASEKQEIRETTGVQITIRVIPTSALDEVQRRLKLQRKDPDTPIESMAIPAFYAPLSILLRAHTKGRLVTVTLERCEVDIESFIASQRPLLREPTEGMSESARKKAQGEKDRWAARERLLNDWLAKADTWQKFVDFWAVDHDYGHRVGEDGKPVFESDWQSFRSRDGQGLKFTAELSYDQPGHYRIAARVTDVFGNDGIATAMVEVK